MTKVFKALQRNPDMTNLLKRRPRYDERYSSARQMYGTEPRYDEPRYNEISIITNTTQKPKLKIHPDITNNCDDATAVECETDA